MTVPVPVEARELVVKALSPYLWSLSLGAAVNDVLAALGLADGSHVIVPVEPTKAMLHAATLIAPTWDDEVSLRKYRAMLTSAKESDRG